MDTGATYPQTAGQDAVAELAWSNVDNIKVAEGTPAYASCCFAGSGAQDASHRLKATNMGFNIPTDATIDGVKVEVMQYCDSPSVLFVEYQAHLLKAGSVTGSNKATYTDLPVSPTLRTYGGESDLWGATLSPADVNDAGFGFAYQVQIPMENYDSFYAYVDYVRITVYYTSAGSSSSQAFFMFL